jgi:hypothetical protein
MISCLESIKKFDPEVPIYVFIDRAKEADESHLEANLRMIDICQKLVADGEITDLRISPRNLATKSAMDAAINWVFEEFESIIFLEDDLLLIDSPREFILQAIINVSLRDDIGIACFFSPRNHLGGKVKFENDFRLTSWPTMWGIFLNREKYLKIKAQLRLIDDQMVHKVVNDFAATQLNSRLNRAFKKRFVSTWVFKYSKARVSAFAWDTEFQLGLWSLGLKSVTPLMSLVADTGVDVTSVSPLKVNYPPTRCITHLKKMRGKQSFCKRCERVRELENFTAPNKLMDLWPVSSLAKGGYL